MKKVLVTGAGGFIGSHLCEHLIRSGYSVRAFVRYNSKTSWGWLESSPIAREIEVVSGDLRDFDSVDHAVDGVDKIFHLGALIGIPYSYVSPLAYIRTNVEGTYNVLESGRKRGVSRIVLTSTSEVYGTARYTPIDEKHPYQPQSPYSATKISADQIGLSYHLSFGTPVVIARPFNTYGPRQSSRAIIPTIITQLLAGVDGKPAKVKIGNLAPTRDLTFSEDTVRGMEVISRTDAFLGKAVNIGSGKEISIGELYSKICALLGVEGELTEESQRVRKDSSEVMRLLSDPTMLTTQTDWRAKITLEDGLKKTIEFLKQSAQHYKTGIYHV